MVYQDISSALKKIANPEKAVFLCRFFKTGPGQYGEGEIFIGITVPQQRSIAKIFYKNCSLEDIRKLLQNEIHEFRLTALIILVLKFQNALNEKTRKTIVDFYLENTASINNWDLVDTSAEKILGAYFFNKNRILLSHLAESNNLWEQRISIIASFYFIKKNQFETTMLISKKLINHKHDLIHKAIGWMLREVGKRNFDKEYDFLCQHYKEMPRTMLRYAIEKFEPKLKNKFLKGLI